MRHEGLCVSLVPLFNHLEIEDQQKNPLASDTQKSGKRRTDSCAEWRVSISDRGFRQYESVSIIC